LASVKMLMREQVTSHKHKALTKRNGMQAKRRNKNLRRMFHSLSLTLKLEVSLCNNLPCMFKINYVLENSRMDSIKKIQLRPKIFTVLYYNDQCEKDKNRVVALNPELAGETTCYR
jgi:hypothetical protein